MGSRVLQDFEYTPEPSVGSVSGENSLMMLPLLEVILAVTRTRKTPGTPAERLLTVAQLTPSL